MFVWGFFFRWCVEAAPLLTCLFFFFFLLDTFVAMRETPDHQTQLEDTATWVCVWFWFVFSLSLAGRLRSADVIFFFLSLSRDFYQRLWRPACRDETPLERTRVRLHSHASKNAANTKANIALIKRGKGADTSWILPYSNKYIYEDTHTHTYLHIYIHKHM